MEVNSRQVGAFVVSMILAGLCYFAIIIIYALSTFSLSGETLNEKENADIFQLIFLVFIVAISIFIIWRKIKCKQLFTAIGISVPLLPLLYILILTAITCINNIDYHRSFNKYTWDKTGNKPFKMAKALVKEKKLVGLPRSQLFDLLGNRDSGYWNDKDYMLYPTDNSGWNLEIWFRNDTVERTGLYSAGFDD